MLHGCNFSWKGMGLLAITAKEIAALAGVSRGTVDRALKDRPRISKETKEKILKIAEQYNYRPNLIGKALVSAGQKVHVAAILTSVGNPFFDDVKDGIYAAVKAYEDYGIELHLTELKGYNPEEFISAIENLDDGTENLIITPLDDEILKEKLEELAEKGMNIVILSSDIEVRGKLSFVGCDCLKSGKIAGRMVGLLSAGHARLCIVTGSTLHPGHRWRVEGVSSVASEYSDIKIVEVIENNDDNETAYKAMKEALNRNEDIDFVCITAGGVQGTLRAIKEDGRKIKVCSFDDIPATKEAMKNGKILATICQQPYEQGYNAVKSIFDKVIAKAKVAERQCSELSIKVDYSIQ